MTTCEQTGPTPRPPGTYGGRGNEMLSQLGSNTVKVVLKRQGDTLLCRDRHHHYPPPCSSGSADTRAVCPAGVGEMDRQCGLVFCFSYMNFFVVTLLTFSLRI